MAQTVIDPPQSNTLIGQNYELFLNKSIDAILNSQTSDPSSSLTTLYKLMQSGANPPLESIWVYSALSFSNKKFEKDKFSDRVSGLNELFELISMFSASCDSAKSIMLLSPVIYEVYKVIVDVKSKAGEMGSKKEKKLMKKIQSLVKSILGFISVCCSGNGVEPDSGLGSDEFIRPFEDLIRVWIGSENCEGLDKKEMFKLFFPILGDELGGDGVSELAGAVIADAFLLRLCLDLCSGVTEQELKARAVGSITGFRNIYFFEWLHNLEDRGIILLGDNILNFRSRIVFDKLAAENETSKYSSGGKQLDPDFVFFIDNKGKVEDENEKAKYSKDRKRKKRKSVEKKRGIKFQKHELYDDSGKKSSSLRNNELDSGSEVENPVADDVESE